MPIDANIPLQGQVANPLNALASGYQLGNTIRQQPMVDQMNQQKLDAGQAQLDAQKLKMQELAKDSRTKAAVMGAAELQSAPVDMWANILQERINGASRYGYGAEAEKEALQILQTKGPEVLKQQVEGLVKFGSMAGLLNNGNTQSAAERYFNQMTQGMSPEDIERAKRIDLGLDPRAVSAAPRPVDYGGVNYIVDPMKNTAQLPTLNQPIGGASPTGQIPPPIHGQGAATSGQGGPAVLDARAVAANAATVKGGEEAGKQGIKMSGDALQKLPDVRRSISNIDQAIAAVDKGANTGVIASKFPSLTAASVELDNLRGSMGLDVIAGTTFGALSEAELSFALDTALPTRLDGPDLRAWLQRKKEVQTKLAKELEDAAIYLGKPGNTPAGWLEMKRNQSSSGDSQKAGGLQPGAVEDGYRFKGGNPADPNNWEAI